jgi:predicted DNA-binding protein
MKKIALTLRLPSDMYEGVKSIAKKKGKSFSGYLREILEKILKEEQKKMLYDAFSQVGRDKEDTNVEYAFEAQKEVVLKDE